jgi:nucleoid-associated protein YgaU
MKLERSSGAINVIIMSVFIALVSFGCSKEAPPEEMATSEAVVAVEEPVVEEAVVEEVVEEVVVEEVVVEEPAPVVSSTHTVEKGESLWGISESSDGYDDPFQWPIIYKANLDQIKDPDLIYPNQKFEIPRDASDAEIESAVHEAKTRGPWSLWDGK